MSKDRRLDALLREFMARGEASRMDEIVRHTRRRLLAAARKIGTAQDAEDAVQAAYYSLLRRCRSPLDAPVMAWLLTAVVRIAYRQKAVARKLTALAAQLDRPAATVPPPARAAQHEEATLLRSAVARLPAKYRDVVVLHHLQSLQVKDVAVLLDVPASTVTTRLQRSRALLRTSLSPHFKHGVVFLPWLLMDLVKGKGAALATSFGGVMNTKAVLVTATAAAAALGFGAAHMSASTQPRRTPDASTSRSVEAAAVADLRQQLASSQAGNATLRAQLAARAPAKARGEAPDARETLEQGHGDPIVSIYDRARAAARELEVSEAAIEAAIRADRVLNKGNRDAQEAWATGWLTATVALTELKRYDREGFRAVIALLRGGIGPAHFDRLFEVTPTEGGHVLLLESLTDGNLSQMAEVAAIIGLSFTDAPEVRNYLVERIQTEEDPQTFFQIARVLAGFKEPRGAAAFESKLLPIDNDEGTERAWRTVRLGLLQPLGSMGGEEAKRVLLVYLRDDSTRSYGQIANGLAALSLIDRDVTTATARAIYAGGRAEFMDPKTLEVLRSQGDIKD